MEKNNDLELIKQLLDSAELHDLSDKIAHVEIHGNKVLGLHLVDGLLINSKSLDDGVDINITVEKGVKLENPVRFCFGLIPPDGVQKLKINTILKEDAQATFIAVCTFPNAKNIQHIMDANITLEKNAKLTYFERHIHGPDGGVTIVPKTKVIVKENSSYISEFELIKGDAGSIDLQYNADVYKDGSVYMTARIYGKSYDKIKILESAHLIEENSAGVLISHLAVKDNSNAMVENEIVADAPYCKGHVDCKEIIQGNAKAVAIPKVTVNDPKAQVTHEAAIGSVDSKQLETLMSRGLSEDEAVDLIVSGLLK